MQSSRLPTATMISFILRGIVKVTSVVPSAPDRARFAALGEGIKPACCLQAEGVAEPSRRPPVGLIPGAHFTRPPCAIPDAADDAIFRAKASDPARFGRIDRSAQRSPCARRCRRTEASASLPSLRASVSSDLRAHHIRLQDEVCDRLPSGMGSIGHVWTALPPRRRWNGMRYT
jgi:hypothetical protein